MLTTTRIQYKLEQYIDGAQKYLMSKKQVISDAFESNAGDDFHILWAARKALSLIAPNTTLKALAVEGPDKNEAEEVDPGGGKLLSIDAAEYYGSIRFTECDKVVFSQLKYSTRRSTETWTASRLCQGKKSGSKGSIIERLADTFEVYVINFGVDIVREKLNLQLVSNRPVAEKLSKALEEAQDHMEKGKPVLWGALKKRLSIKTIEEIDRLYKASKLKSRDFTVFLSKLNLDDCGAGSRFEHEMSLIEELSNFDDPRVKDQYLRLRRLIEIRMLPEGRGLEAIVEQDLAPVFEIGSFDQAFPANSEFGQIGSLIERKQLKDIAYSITKQKGKVTCIHAGGGSGKTSLCRTLPEHFPEYSETVIFDCYGNGSYTNPAKIRHIHRRAIVQIANEIATRVGSNLLLRFNGPKEDFLENLIKRCETAARLKTKENPEALLVIIIDAADNSYSASQMFGDDNFVKDLTNKDFVASLPDCCRIVVTTRTHRKPNLDLPLNTEEIVLNNFDQEESAEVLRSFFPGANNNNVKDFHAFSAGIPRRQAYALNKKEEGVEAVLEALTPTGVSVEGVIDKQLEEAGKKLGIADEVDSICKSLVCLPTPIPIEHVAAISEVNERAIWDFCEDMFPGLRLENNAVSFTDEDFETHLKNIYKSSEAEWSLKATEHLLNKATKDIYAAENIAYFLYQSKQFESLFDITINRGSLDFIIDPILQKNIFVNRAQLALKSAIQSDDKETLLKLLLVAARAAKTDKAVRQLITENADLTSRYGDYQTIQRLYLEERETHWYGPSHLHCAANLSRDEDTCLLAKEHLKNASAWLKWRHQRDNKELKRYPIEDDDIAAETEAIYNLFGFEKAYLSLMRWRPKEALFRISDLVFERVINNQKADELCEAIKQNPLRPDVELILIERLFSNGLQVPKEFIDSNYKIWRKFAALSKSVGDNIRSSGVLFCELLAVNGYKPDDIFPLIDLFSPSVPEYTSLYDKEGKIDVLMRAKTLKALLSKADLTFEDLLPTKLKKAKDLTNEEQRRREGDTQEFKRIYEPLLSAYKCRVKALTKNFTGKPDKLIENALGGSRIEYQVRGTEKIVLQNLLSFVFVDSALLVSKTPEKWVDAIQNKFLKNGMSLVTRSHIARKLSHHKNLQAKALMILDQITKVIEENPMNASEQADMYIKCSTIADRINADVAGEYYKKAIEAAEEIDHECFSEIICLSRLSEKAAEDDNKISEPELAYYMASYVETCARRMDGYDHFPWTEGVRATTFLDGASGFATISRWHDRGINYIDDEIFPVLSAAVKKGYISPRFGTALLIMADYKDGRASDTRTNLLKAELENKRPLKDLLSIISQDILLHDEIDDRKYKSEKIIDWVKENSPKDIRNINDLILMHDFIDNLHKKTKKEDDDFTHEQIQSKRAKTKVDWRFLGKKDFCKSKDLEDAVSFLDKQQKYGYEIIHEFFERIQKRCDQDKYIEQLDALINCDPDIVPFYPLEQAIKSRLDAWNYHTAVRTWQAENLTKFVKIHFHEFLSHDRFSTYTLNGIAEAFGIPDDEKRIEIVTPILPDYVDHIPAEAFYDIAQAYLQLIPVGSGLNVLRWYLFEIKKDIRFDLGGGDWSQETAPPKSAEKAIPSFLWTCLSNPDKRVRWRTAHAIRRLVKLCDIDILGAIIKASQIEIFKAFKDKNHIFYYYSARLWLFIVLDRIAKENPVAVLPHAQFIYAEAVQESNYHALIRHFAKETALTLAQYKGAPYTKSNIKALQEVCVSPFEQIEKTRGYGSQGRDNEEGRFSFGYDTTKSWYPCLERTFDVSRKEFLEKAEKIICDEWGYEGKVWEQDPLHHRNGGNYSYELTSNKDGSETVVENLQRYLEYHVMFFLADDFLKTRPIVKDWEDDPWEDWIKRWNLVRDPFWLSDLRDATPLEPEFWTMPRSNEKTWVYEIMSPYLDRHAGIIDCSHEGYLLVNGHIYRAHDKNTESIYVSSALVEPEKAFSLLRALQTCANSSNYKIPDEGEDLEIDAHGFQLKGWINELTAEWGGVDELDPLQARLCKSIHKVNQDFLDWAEAKVSEDGRRTYLAKDPKTIIALFENWNDFKHKRYEYGLKTEGNRLFVDKEYLLDFLSKKQKCLILECQIRRSGEKDDRGYYPGYARLYLLKPNGKFYTL